MMVDFLSGPFTWFLWVVVAGAVLKMVVYQRRAEEARREIDLLRLDLEFQGQHEHNLVKRYRALVVKNRNS